MKTYFPRIRRLAIWSSIVWPILLFVAFLCFAQNWGGWAFIALLLGIILLCAFPTERIDEEAPENAAKDVKRSIGERISRLTCVIAFGLILLWLVNLPEYDAFLDFIDNLKSTGRLWDWRLILAASIWTLNAIYVSCRNVRSLRDQDIIAFFDDTDPKATDN